ncbi:MAG: DUF3365 domain-containing protein [Planctomycetota bacterium]|nr:DUF3365 domain-containing protein [Planctomycetota bacterium]
MRFWLAALAAVLLLGGCGDPTDRHWTVLGSQLTPEQEEQSRTAVKARDAMFGQLFARLQAAVKKGGPAEAIAVCQEAAPAIAKAIGKKHGVRIGRTALKLRNPENAPPDWAVGYVGGDGGVPVQLQHEDGRFAALLPIRLQVGCLGCHGASESIAPPVKAALAERYPDDKATGFKAGDLRGWFWVEVPAP